MDDIDIKNYRKKYYLEHLEKAKEYQKKWRKANRKKYIENYQRYNKEHPTNKEYHSEQMKKWRKTEKGKLAKIICKSKRRRKKCIQILPNIFPENISVDYHHADGNWFIVPLPTTIHEKLIRSGDLSFHLKENMDWIEFFYNLNMNAFLQDGMI